MNKVRKEVGSNVKTSRFMAMQGEPGSESRSLDVFRAGILPHQPAGPFEVLGRVHVHEEIEFASSERDSCRIGTQSV